MSADSGIKPKIWRNEEELEFPMTLWNFKVLGVLNHKVSLEIIFMVFFA